MVWALTNLTKSVDLTPFVEMRTLVVQDRAYANTSRLTATIRDEAGTLVIDDDDEILWDDGTAKAFAGFVRQRRKTDTGVSGQRVYEIECQDYTTLLADDVIDSDVTTPGESDADRIAAVFAAFGTRGVVIGADVQELRAVMPDQPDLIGLNLHEFMTAIESVVGARFYVDYDKHLHHFDSETNAAPFGLSDDPNGTTTFGYQDFVEASDTVDRINAVFVKGDGVSTWRYPGGVPPAAGTRRAGVIRDPMITDIATAEARGDSLLASYGTVKKPSSLVTYKPGLRAGMYVQVTHAGWGISAVSYRIAGIRPVPESKDRIAYQLDFGNASADLATLLSSHAAGIADAQAMAAAAAASTISLADLSIGGANLVPNSSFEDGTAWVVGAQWAIGFDPTPPDEPLAGSKTARIALTAQTAGDLVTPKLPVADDDYLISFYHFIRSRSSGTLRAFVREYDASNVLLATTNLDLTAVDTDWTRAAWHFGPTAGLGVIAWQVTTTKIEVGFNTAGANATMTADVDGVQVERGNLATAYAPAPQEIVAGSIGTTLIADDAVTTPKLIAEAVTAGKLAAGAVTTAKLDALAVTADKIAAGTIDATRLAVGGVGTLNMLRNGSFEDVLAPADANYTTDPALLYGWSILSLSKAQFPSTTGFEKIGNRVAYVARDSGSPSTCSIYQRVPVVAGRRYRLSGFYGMQTTQYDTSPDTIAKRASTTASTNNGLTVTPAIPAGTLGGDVLIAIVANRKGSDGTIAAPAGWTQLDQQRNSTTVLGAAIFRKVAAGVFGQATTEQAPRFTLAAAGTKGAAVLIAFSGVDNTTPVVASLGQVNASSTNIVHPALTSTGHAMRVILSAIANDSTISNVATWTGPAADETVASGGGTAGSRNRTALQRKADTADNPGSVTATAGTAGVNVGFQLTLKAGTLITNLRSARLVAHALSKSGALVTSNAIASLANGTGTISKLGAEYTIPTDGTVSYLEVHAQVQGSPTTGVGVFEDVELAPADLIAASGDVVIDGTGITVTNGKITVQNAGATVIIDGTSNMFKISASGTIETIVTGGVITSATVNLGAMGGTTPAYEAFTGSTLTIDAARKSGGDNPQWDSPQLYYTATSSGGAVTAPIVGTLIVTELYMRLTAGEAIVTMDVTCATGASFSSYGTYYIYKESAI